MVIAFPGIVLDDKKPQQHHVLPPNVYDPVLPPCPACESTEGWYLAAADSKCRIYACDHDALGMWFGDTWLEQRQRKEQNETRDRYRRPHRA